MLTADKPITSDKQDVLGRAPFARAVADAILSYCPEDSLVLGLYGPWGSGKTSLIEMICESIDEKQRDADHGLRIVRFHPWLLSDQRQLCAEFFRLMSSAVRRTDNAVDAAKIGQRLQSYARFFDAASLVPVLNVPLTAVGAVLRQVGGATQTWGESHSKDIQSIKDEISQLLASQSDRMLIVIDDIDRLTATEIRLIFQLVKTMADFPRTIYLLSFDWDAVVRALEKTQNGSGASYLEKIVQVPIELPVSSRNDISAYFLSRLAELLEGMGITNDHWDLHRWGNLYGSGIRHMMNNLRDANRLLNSISFGLGIVTFEVDPVDFVAITAIQVFLPSLYAFIRDNSDLFAGVSDTLVRNNPNTRLQNLLSEKLVPYASKEQDMINFLCFLFPRLDSVFKNTSWSTGYVTGWKKARRICSPDLFEVYFRLSLPPGKLSKDDVSRIVKSAANLDDFRAELEQAVKSKTDEHLLESITDEHLGVLDTQSKVHVISALLDYGDALPASTGSLRDRSYRLSFFISKLVESIAVENRADAFCQAMQLAPGGLYQSVLFINLEEAQSESGELLIREPDLSLLKEQALTRTKKWAATGKLLHCQRLVYILWRWSEWGVLEDVKNFVADAISTASGLAEYVLRFVQTSQSQTVGDYVARHRGFIKPTDLHHFVPSVEEFEAKVRAAMQHEERETLTREQLSACQLYIDTIAGKAWSPDRPTRPGTEQP